MIRFSCSECSQSYRVSDDYAGKRVRCKGCNHINTIPQPENDATAGSGDSIAAYNNLLQELSKAEKNAPTVEID